MARIDMDHDGMEVRLGPGVSLGWLAVWIGVAVLGALGFFVAVSNSVMLGALSAVAGLAAMLAAFRVATGWQRTIVCDGKTVSFGDGQRCSLLDLRSVTAHRRKLWFEPEVGPLRPFSTGPYREEQHELESVAELLNSAIEQAQHKRGDAPDARYYAMREVLAKER